MSSRSARPLSDVTGSRRRVSSKAAAIVIVVAVVMAGALVWRLSDGPPVRDGAPSWSPDGLTVVFAAEVGTQPADLYLMNSDGSHRRRLGAETPWNETNPAYSPHGDQIAFESDRDGSDEIYVLNLTTREIRRLTQDPARDSAPAWSPDGARIAFMSDRNSRASTDIYTMNARDGSDVRRLTQDLSNWAPEYSPDGRSIALQVDRDVHVLDVASGRLRRLTWEPNNGMDPTWSPDGSRIAFVTTRHGRAEIYSMGVDGSDQKPMVSMPGGNVIDPRWAPTGDQLAFVYVAGLGPGEQASSREREAVEQTQAIYRFDTTSGRVTRLSR
jgi:Tol biopolymer transport system component